MSFTYENRHKGEIIAVLGNGPSMAKIDFQLLDRFTTIGTNNIVRIYDPNYLVLLDKKAMEWYWRLVEKSEAIKFYTQEEDLPFVYHRYIKYLPGQGSPKLAPKFTDGLCWSYTSIFPAISLAYIFGARAVILLGVDMNDNSHFYSDDDGTKKGGMPFPTMNLIHRDFAELKGFCDESKFTVYNGNPDSAIEDFEFINFDESFIMEVGKKKFKTKKPLMRGARLKVK